MDHPLGSLRDHQVVVLGGTGVLGQALVAGLAEAGANLHLVGRDEAKLSALASQCGAHPHLADATDLTSLRSLAAEIGSIQGLVCAIGGNRPAATLPPDADFFGLDPAALAEVFDLNLYAGFLWPLLAFGPHMAEGSVVALSSVSATLPLSRVGAYGAAKAGLQNLTQWSAVELGRRTHGKVRVNAVQPGFFLTEQNRFLLTTPETGEPTERGKAVLGHTPAGRFGQPGDLVGAVKFLLSPDSAFVTGIVLPVDGGFTAWWGV